VGAREPRKVAVEGGDASRKEEPLTGLHGLQEGERDRVNMSKKLLDLAY
jgi:hypothetical protein